MTKSDQLELVERAWQLIGIRSFSVRLGVRAYKGTYYAIIVDRHDGNLGVYYRSAPSGFPRKIYYMTAEGGPGLIDNKLGAEVLGCMRNDMVLDDLASIR